MSRRTPLLSILLLLGFVSTAMLACTEEQRQQREYRQEQKTRKKAIDAVTERAEAYMLAVRWRDFQAASVAYEDVGQQIAFLQRMTDSPQSTIESYAVDFVLVDEAGERAEVRLTLSEVEYTTQRLRSRTDTQLWYLSDKSMPKQWFLVPVEVLLPE